MPLDDIPDNTGHNAPRLDAETIKAASEASATEMTRKLNPRSDEIVAAAKVWQGVTKLDDSNEAKAADFDEACAAHLDDIEKEFKTRKAPYWDAGKLFDATKKGLLQPVDAARPVVEKLLQDRRRELAEELRRKQKAAADEAARIQHEADEATAKAAAGDVDAKIEADRLAEDLKASEKEVKRTASAAPALRSSSGRATRGTAARIGPEYNYDVVNWGKAALAASDDLEVQAAVMKVHVRRHKQNLAAQKAGNPRPHVLAGFIKITEKGTN